MEPIRISNSDDFLVVRENDIYEGDDPVDKSALAYTVGVHDVCNGSINTFQVNKTQSVLTCMKCNLRVTFPMRITTYGELRDYFSEMAHYYDRRF